MADRELKTYREEKRREQERKERPAKALDPAEPGEEEHRDGGRAGDDRDVPPDARGQARRGRIDQVITSKGHTETQ